MLFRSLIIGSLFAVSCVSAAAQARINIAAETTVDGETISLGQISRISARPEVASRLETISLGYAPGVGMTREVSPSNIQLSLRAAGFSEGDTTIIAPARITVRRAAQTVDQQQLRVAVETAVKKQFEGTSTDCEIVRIDMLEAPLVPVGVVEVKATLGSIRNFIERLPVQMEIRVDGRLYRTMTATVEMALHAEVAVAATDIAANQPVREKDVKIERTRLERSPASYFRDLAAFKAVQTVRPIMAGKPFMTDSIVAATVIKLGDPVRIEASTGRIKIVINGEARANGRIGERISVKNKDSGVIMQAIVVDQGLVKVVI
jgi:flagellar basal body P-ring formation protein FlgA